MAYYFLDMATTQKTFFGDKLKALRLEKGLTQTDLGNRVGLSRRMLVHYEKHATRPPADKVMALANALGLSVNELVKVNGKTTAAAIDPKFARKLEKARKLPHQDQKILAGIIDSFLQKNGLRKNRKAAKKNAVD
jgi:transcriptional regulator with XRE-family HTH domain